ncbi:MAG: hypothetical protein F2934_02210 [Actinobacteria bacterium]|uniref:Unannotated protein n=1 Tax=freshwater metagenome TaxID=449393 RepID=A0A6J6SRY0_9ZZZZ|nr:hypothetical protein [Actinomycetota bacterium]MSY13734.1 hypothetical protein [Actinomycetota bacterium]MSZ02957.1 hypothetical protein [Actinomycetota bacterium]MTB05927.1 hypothetical protein [Actinomycetota bacterium]
MRLPRTTAAVAVGLAALTASCGASTPSGSSTTTSPVSDPKGVPARDVSTDAPFALAATPSHLSPGERLVLSVTGDRSGDWVGGAQTNVDLKVGETWRTLWWIANEESGSVMQSIGSGTEATVPAVAVPLATDVAFRVPAALTPRQYRFCREYTTSGGQTKAYVCAFAFVVKD